MTDTHAETALDTAPLSWCHDVVPTVSRSFAVTIRLLDAPMSDYICVGYLLCRVPDTVEDAGHIPPREKARLLRQYDGVLDPTDETTVEAFLDAVERWIPDDGDDDDDWTVVRETARIVEAFEGFDEEVRAAMRPPVRELVVGMAEFVERGRDDTGLRLDTREELDQYCYVVAGTVGHLITNLVTLDADPETERYLRARAEGFGNLLQLVNVAKDVHTDYHEEDNIYVPREWLGEDVPQDRLLADEHRDGTRRALRRVIGHARSFRADAHEYLERCARTAQLSLAPFGLPYLLALATLRELEGNLDDVLSGTSVKVSREEVHELMTALTAAPFDPTVLDRLERTVEAER
ncbi:phytoene/squalene synthase family protein [Halomarina oriensis]|uniref:Farnesyl-diphosphate farnesyltransferase n=1 Tax=Halomarina oriensis TaxID=671145 RepID=A0A6B0GMS6_9EURY|nr:phytoene/squalene synthase family protein [Halomarina oriensis]MWG34013.1 farnesyl-diphosphate farnesyltransferase [Halomarina oriensis]